MANQNTAAPALTAEQLAAAAAVLQQQQPAAGAPAAPAPAVQESSWKDYLPVAGAFLAGAAAGAAGMYYFGPSNTNS